MMRLLKVSARGVRRNWRQSLAALIAIASGFVSLSLFQGYMDDVQRTYVDANRERGMMGDFIIEGYSEFMSPEDQAIVMPVVESDPRVFAKVRFLDLSGQITNGSTSMIFIGTGYDTEEGAKLRGPVWSWNTIEGHPFRASDGNESLILGMSLTHILDCDTRYPKGFVNGTGGFKQEESPVHCPFPSVQLSLMTDKGQMNGIDFQLAGVTDVVYKELDERYVSMPLPAAQALLDTKKISRMAVRVHDSKDIDATIKDFNEKFRSSGFNGRAVRWQEHKLGDLYNRTMGMLSIFRNFVVTVILIISCLSVFNTFIRNVSERSREIGTLRSIGFRSSHVATIFLGEALFLALIGCIVGILLSLAFQGVINGAGISYKPGVFSTPVPFRIAASFGLMFKTAIFMCVLITITSWFSVRAAVRRRIVECLGHV